MIEIMFLYPSSQYFNQFRQTQDIPLWLQNVLIDGSNRQCWVSPRVQILSQQIAHPEFDLYVHYVFSNGAIELFGKTTTKKWVWVMQHEKDSAMSLPGLQQFTLNENEHIFVQAEGAKENRFSFAQGRSVTLMISLKPIGEKMLKQFYSDLWKRLEKPALVAVHSSTFIERYYREGLRLPVTAPVLLNAFLSERVRMLLLIFNQQLIDTPKFRGVSHAIEQKVILAKRLLDQYPGEVWTLRELARRTGWNIQDLKTVFKRIYAASPIEYLRQVRLQLGIMLVQSTTKTVVEISRTCGFKRPHHFIRVFKAFMGKTPGQLRKDQN